MLPNESNAIDHNDNQLTDKITFQTFILHKTL